MTQTSTSDIAHLHCGVFYRMWMFQVASMRKGVSRIKGIPYVRIIMRNEKTSAKLLKPPDRDKLFGKGISFLAAELVLGPRPRCSSPHTFPHSTSHGCCSAAVLQAAVLMTFLAPHRSAGEGQLSTAKICKRMIVMVIFGNGQGDK